MYCIDENGYGWRPRPAPFFGTRLDLLRLFAIALMARIQAGLPRGSAPRRTGHRVVFPKGTTKRHGAPGSRRKRYVGSMSYDAWKAEQAAERAAKSTTL